MAKHVQCTINSFLHKLVKDVQLILTGKKPKLKGNKLDKGDVCMSREEKKLIFHCNYIDGK